jgi:hypothetical protein
LSGGEVHFNWLIPDLSQELRERLGAGLKIRLSLDLDEAMMGAWRKNRAWLNMTGECSSAPLAGSRPAFYQ